MLIKNKWYDCDFDCMPPNNQCTVEHILYLISLPVEIKKAAKCGKSCSGSADIRFMFIGESPPYDELLRCNGAPDYWKEIELKKIEENLIDIRFDCSNESFSKHKYELTGLEKYFDIDVIDEESKKVQLSFSDMKKWMPIDFNDKD